MVVCCRYRCFRTGSACLRRRRFGKRLAVPAAAGVNIFQHRVDRSCRVGIRCVEGAVGVDGGVVAIGIPRQRLSTPDHSVKY